MAEPTLDTDGLADVPAMQAPTPAGDDMPVWLRDPLPPASSGAPFKRAAMLAGGSLAALALAFAGTMWLFSQGGPEPAIEVAAPNAPAPLAPAAPELPPLQPRSSTLPPLVLLAPAPDPAGTGSAPVPVVASAAPRQAGVALNKIDNPAPVLAKPPAAKMAAKPALAKAAPKVPAARKVLLAKNVQVQPKVKPAPGARKPLVAAKRAPAQAKARPKLLASVSLPPARGRSPERAALTHKCLPGELARECAARQ